MSVFDIRGFHSRGLTFMSKTSTHSDKVNKNGRNTYLDDLGFTFSKLRSFNNYDLHQKLFVFISIVLLK